MKRSLSLPLSLGCAALLGTALAPQSFAQPWRLIAISGQQGDETPGPNGFLYPDHTLFEVDATTGALTKLFQATFINDSLSIGFNPKDHLLYHTGGSESYSNNPLRSGHDQGGPTISGVGYQDSQYMETIDLATQTFHAIFNADPCPNPDETLPCFGLPAPLPTWVLPTERRDSTQTGGEFRARGVDEYHAARGMAWSAASNVFYISDEQGIFQLSPTGDSKFLARPAFPIDGKLDEAKGIAFVREDYLLVGHRSSGLVMRVNPETGDPVSEITLAVPEGGGDPVDNFGGLLGMAQNPQTGVVYGVRNTSDHFARELVTIDPLTGATKLVGNLGMHIAGITFARPSDSAPWKLYGITGQQQDETPGDLDGFAHPDHTVFEIDTTTAAITKLWRLVWVNDSVSIGFNPVDHKLYYTAGSQSYSNNPLRNGNDQGQPKIAGVGYQDSQYMETVDLVTGAEHAIFNAAPCPNPDTTLPCFGFPAPRPTWVLPEVQRDSTQTGGEFRARGTDEYDAVRALAWSKAKNLFYIADATGIYKLTADGASTFLAQPAFSDAKTGEDKAIAFVTVTNLMVGHKDGASGVGYIMRVNAATGDVLGDLALAFPAGGGDPQDAFGGLLGLAQHPVTGVLYGIRNTGDHFARELVTIDPMTGATTLVGSMGMHISDIVWTQAAPAADVNMTVLSQTSGSITLAWSGGTGKFLLQKKADIGAANWINVLTTTDHLVTVAKDGLGGYFRVQSDYSGPDVLPLTAYLSGDGEKPNAVTTTATGVGTLSLQGNTLSYLVTYNGLSSASTGSHIHGSSTVDSTTSGPIMVGFPTPSGTQGYISGTAALTDAQRDLVLAGRSYVNIHTGNNPGGEIRGNVLRTQYSATMNGANERPNPVATAGTGLARIGIIGNELTYNVSWGNLSGSASAGHIHGRADANGTATVIQGFSGITGASGTATGTVVVGQNVLGAILDGMAYANIHTAANPGGEIRGQVLP